MKQNLILLSQRYVTALRRHMKQSPAVIPPGETALALGQLAVALGVEVLELARIHEHALVTLGLSAGKKRLLQRAEVFFAGALIPVVEKHRPIRQGQAAVSRLQEMLGQRTEELAVSHRQVQRGAVRRKIMADAFAKSGKRHDKNLAESLELQERLRKLTHKVMASQENERKKISHELQDEIAQTLLGINVRLLSLKQGANGNLKGLKNEIASTQRLVVKSAKSVRRFARELGVRHPA